MYSACSSLPYAFFRSSAKGGLVTIKSMSWRQKSQKFAAIAVQLRTQLGTVNLHGSGKVKQRL